MTKNFENLNFPPKFFTNNSHFRHSCLCCVFGAVAQIGLVKLGMLRLTLTTLGLSTIRFYSLFQLMAAGVGFRRRTDLSLDSINRVIRMCG